MKKEELDALLKDIYDSMQTIFGNKMKAVILYGSYARGDYDAESDVDIAVLVDSDRESLSQYHQALVKQMSRFMMDYDRLVSLTDIPASDFDAYRNILPFYRNIDAEGVRLSA
ncbi:MAG: nucleotidyltransferase domain-containing protein [Lachnospiraceae bacterium]|nr:nucleotidyltransferase domain-containing protein [Lachnospiraceae bacterium]